MMCLNLAIVHGKLNSPDEALLWYEEGVQYELRQGGHFVAESRAGYLAELGRHRESLAHYRDLLAHPGLTEVDKERVRKNIELLQKMLASVRRSE